MFIASTLSNQYTLLFIYLPSFIDTILIIGMSMFAYQTNLGLLASEVEDQLNEILGAFLMLEP
jgi:hypothetical protein